MAVHFSFAATKFRKSVPCIGESLSLTEFKDAIAAPLVAALKGKKLREAFDFRVYDSDTKTEILGADSKIRKNASVIVKRVPYFQVKTQFSDVALSSSQSSALSSISTQSQSSSLAPISTESIERSNVSSTRSEVIDDDFGDEIYSAHSSCKTAPSASISTYSEVIDDEFGDNVYAANEVVKTSSKKRAAPHDESISTKRRMKEQSDFASKPAVNVRSKQETVASKREESAVQSVEKLPTEFTCPLCNKMLKDPMMIPCCFLTFCGDCIKVALATQKKCPKCPSCKFGVANLLHNRHMNMMIDARLKSSSSASNPR